MAKPTTREEFKQYCLRNLGHPVIEVNVDDEQLDDRVDEALAYYKDYHFDGSAKYYFKYQVTANNRNDAVYDVTINDGGTGYSNTDTVVYTGGGSSNTPSASITTDANGTIIAVTQDSFGNNYGDAPNVTVTSGTGSGAALTAQLGGFIEIPENILGVVRMFNLASALNTQNIFSIQYQIVLNDLYNLSSVSMVPYYMTFQHLRLLEELLVGQQPIRYNRHKNKCYIDTNWSRFNNDRWIILECYEYVDPETYTDVWDDRWLKEYCTALFKRQWGNNTKKYGQMQLPGGMYFNGQQIFDEAIQEIKALEEEMITSYSLPVSDMIATYAPFIINTSIGLSIIGGLISAWNSIPMV